MAQFSVQLAAKVGRLISCGPRSVQRRVPWSSRQPSR